MKKMPSKNKELSIKDLASSMEKGFKAQGQNLESLAMMVAKGFASIEERMATKDEMDRKFAEVEKSLTKIRVGMLDIGDRFVSNHRFDELLSRFNVLEAKVKGKK